MSPLKSVLSTALMVFDTRGVVGVNLITWLATLEFPRNPTIPIVHPVAPVAPPLPPPTTQPKLKLLRSKDVTVDERGIVM